MKKNKKKFTTQKKAILKAHKNPESRYDKGFLDKFFAIEDEAYEFLCNAAGISMEEYYDAV